MKRRLTMLKLNRCFKVRSYVVDPGVLAVVILAPRRSSTTE
jgi:hypothetical protein